MGNMLKPSRGIEFQKSTEVRSIAESEQRAEKEDTKGESKVSLALQHSCLRN